MLTPQIVIIHHDAQGLRRGYLIVTKKECF